MKLVCVATSFFGFEASSIDEMAAVLQTNGALMDRGVMVVASFNETTSQFTHAWSDGVRDDWFGVTRNSIQPRADKLHDEINKCIQKEHPKLRVQQAARDQHARCRVEQASLLTLNTTKNCNDDKKKDCDRHQVLLELESCALHESHNGHCADRVTCYESAKKAHGVENDAIKEQEKILKEEFVEYKKFLCRVREWPLTSVTNTECAKLDPDTGHLDIKYLDPPKAMPACPSAPSKPGDDGWIAAEYNNETWKALVEATPNCTTDFSALTEVAFSVKSSSQYDTQYGVQCLKDGSSQAYLHTSMGCGRGDGGDGGFFFGSDNGGRGTVTFTLDAPRNFIRFVVYNTQHHVPYCTKEMKVEHSMTGVDAWEEVKLVTLACFPGGALNQPQNLDVKAFKASKFWRFDVVKNEGALTGLQEVLIKA